MKPIFAFAVLALITFSYGCSSFGYASLEDLRYNLYADSVEVISEGVPSTTPPPDYVDISAQPKPVYMVSPTFPIEGRRMGVDGDVWVKMWLTKKGFVRRAVIQKSSNSVFNQSALLAGIQWCFEPARAKNGEPVAVWVAIPFKYRINK